MSIFNRATYYQRLAKELEETLPEDAIVSALDAMAILKARIQRKGEDFTGARFSSYTPAYAKYGRTSKGYQDDYKDYTRTGQLFKSLKATIEKQDAESVTIDIGPDNAKDQAKVNGAFEKDGNILLLSESERDLALQGFAQRRIDRINNFK